MIRFVIVALLGAGCLGMMNAPAAAQNLHQYYGSHWDCDYISNWTPLHKPCKACEARGEQFFKDSETSGHCVPKTGARSQEPDRSSREDTGGSDLSSEVSRARQIYDRARAAASGETDVKCYSVLSEADEKIAEIERSLEERANTFHRQNAGTSGWKARYDRIEEAAGRVSDIRLDLSKKSLQCLRDNRSTQTKPDQPLKPATREANEARFRIQLCNNARRGVITAAVAAKKLPEDERVTVQGWWSIPPFECKFVMSRFFGKWSNAHAYVFGHTSHYEWPSAGSVEGKFCVPSSRFERQNTKGYKCTDEEKLRGFAKITIAKPSSDDEDVVVYKYSFNE